MQQLWQELVVLADADPNGRISKDEFTLSVGKVVENDPKGTFAKAFRKSLLTSFRMTDTDGDSVVHAEEFTTYMKFAGFSQEEASKAFAFVDANGDGALSIDEWIVGSMAFYTTSDPNSPVNSITSGT